MSVTGHTGSASAFPLGQRDGIQPEYGLTKRELFAAMAMQGFCANAQLIIAANGQDVGPFIVKAAMECADNLLRALEAQ